MTPHPKVIAGSLAGSAATLLIYICAQFGVNLTPEAASAATTVIFFIAAYLYPKTGGEVESRPADREAGQGTPDPPAPSH